MLHLSLLLLMMSLPHLSDGLLVPCQAQLEAGVQYRKVIWYKVTASNSTVGLVMKDLRKNTILLYRHAAHSYQVRDDLSLLFMPESMEEREEQCETYRCSVWPPVGHHIQESDSTLPQGCLSRAEVVSARQELDMQTGSSSVPYVPVLVAVGVLLLVLLCGVVLLYKQRERYTKVPV